MPTYAKCRRDAEFLEGLVEAGDWVEVDAEVESLMRDPTKRKAAELYGSVIAIWASEHSDGPHFSNPKVRKIMRDHGHEYYLT